MQYGRNEQQKSQLGNFAASKSLLSVCRTAVLCTLKRLLLSLPLPRYVFFITSSFYLFLVCNIFILRHHLSHIFLLNDQPGKYSGVNILFFKIQMFLLKQISKFFSCFFFICPTPP